MRTVRITDFATARRSDATIGADEAVRRVAALAAELEPRHQFWQDRFERLLLDCAHLPGMQRVCAGRDPSDALADHFGLCAGACRTGNDAAGYPGVSALAPRLARLLVEGKSVNLDLSLSRPCAAEVAPDKCDLAELPRAISEALAVWGVSFEPAALSLRVDHPDVRGFVGMFRDPAGPGPRLVVKLSDAFMEAVRDRVDIPLVHRDPPATAGRDAEVTPEGFHIFGRVSARTLWDELMQIACSAPGVELVFAGLSRPSSPLAYAESTDTVCPNLFATVPAESALTPVDIHLDRLLTPPGAVNVRKLKWAVETAVRLADNLIDCIRWPLDGIKLDAIAHRRVALNVRGIGDAVVKMGLDPCRFQSLARLYGIMQFVRDTAYKTSVSLARERHAFPGLRTADLYALMPRPELQESVRKKIDNHGTRNSHLIAMSPYAMLPHEAHGDATRKFADLLPLLRFADLVGFGDGQAVHGVEPADLAQFLRLTWAYARTISRHATE